MFGLNRKIREFNDRYYEARNKFIDLNKQIKSLESRVKELQELYDKHEKNLPKRIIYCHPQIIVKNNTKIGHDGYTMMGL